MLKPVEDLGWNVLAYAWNRFSRRNGGHRLLAQAAFYGVDLYCFAGHHASVQNIAKYCHALPWCNGALPHIGFHRHIYFPDCSDVYGWNSDNYQQTYNISATIPVQRCLESRAELCHLARVIPLRYFYFFLAWIHTRQVDQEFGAQNFEQPLMVVLPIFWVKYNKPSVGLLCSGAV